MKSKILKPENLLLIPFLIGIYYFFMCFGLISNTLSYESKSKIIPISFCVWCGSMIAWVILGWYNNHVKVKKEIEYITNNGLFAVGELQKAAFAYFGSNSNGLGHRVTYMKLIFKVITPTGETWIKDLITIVPIENNYMLAPGTKFNLKYLSRDKNRMIIIWP